MIALHDVTVCYDKARRHAQPSLDNVSLTVQAGELVFLVGPSGAGKSSLLKLLYAGVRPDTGKVLVDGKDISRLGAGEIPALRRKIGVVFQDFQLLTEKTAFENVAFALRVIGVPQSVIVREVPRALETVGISHRSHAYPHELSGGEQQRVAIARAIVNDPVLLLADEPTGNLDPETAAQIGDLLAAINKDRGTTVVLVTHDQALVDNMQRRVVRLRDGHIAADDSPGYYHPEDAPGYIAPVDPTAFLKMVPDPVEPTEPVQEAGVAAAARAVPPPDQAVPSSEPAPVVRRSTDEGGPKPGRPQTVPLAAEPESSAEPAEGYGGSYDGGYSVPSRPSGSGSEANKKESNVSGALGNVAPLGTAENPIVLYDR